MPDRLDTAIGKAFDKTIDPDAGNVLGTAVSYKRSGSPTSTALEIDFDVPAGNDVEKESGGRAHVRTVTVGISKKTGTGLTTAPLVGDTVTLTATGEVWVVEGPARTIGDWWSVDLRKVQPTQWSATRITKGAV